MTTFKNNAKYAELLLTYMDVAMLETTPLRVSDVLSKFKWRFKGGSMEELSAATRFAPETSRTHFPDGLSEDILAEWPNGKNARALREILRVRRTSWKPKNRAVAARYATYLVLTSSFGFGVPCEVIHSGMKSIYHLFGLIWDWAPSARNDRDWMLLHDYTREMLFATGAISRAHLPTVEENRKRYEALLGATRVMGLLKAIKGVKELIRTMGGPQVRSQARRIGQKAMEEWEYVMVGGADEEEDPSAEEEHIAYQRVTVGRLTLRVAQQSAVYGVGKIRYALSKSDAERLHQMLMSAASALVGVCAQASAGTKKQRAKASLAVEIAEKNIERIVQSSRKVPLGDEVLVCKGYRRAYTAMLGVLAGRLCAEETRGLIEEANTTAAPGVIDVDGFLMDARRLDAANALNTAKMFKICAAPDVSPGGAMLDRIKQIGNGNVVDKSIMEDFTAELRAQILRAHVRSGRSRMKVRKGMEPPHWFGTYTTGEPDKVPSDEIHTYLAWEGSATMPDMSKYDPGCWKDAGIGVDTIAETTKVAKHKHMSNMMTRLLFDDECPMPGHKTFTDDRVIKFFVKAEGHKDPARGIFSANLADRQVQSWMEKAVERIALHHPSFMIGQPLDVKDAKVRQLVERPSGFDQVAMYYSFDISGWSAKMPGEVQKISHSIWAELYNEDMFRGAYKMNEGSHIYLDLDGYRGWFKNTHANLEGFNGKEMTMVLVALLSLAVKRWRKSIVQKELATQKEASSYSALLFAYIDDGLSRLDLPKKSSIALFNEYKRVVIETFSMCGFSVETTKCFPSDRFAIFLNEVYLAGRHVVHGVRAAMAISSEPSERHNTLIERTSSVSTGARGATMAGLPVQSAVMLMSYHTVLHLVEWVTERDPVILAAWSVTPRSWGGLGMPNMLQMYTSGSGAAFEEGVATLQAYARINRAARAAFVSLVKCGLKRRTAVSVLTAPLSGQVEEGIMVDSRVSVEVRKSLQDRMDRGHLSTYAERLIRYSDPAAFALYADCIVPLGEIETLQEQMLIDVAEAHPHSVFSSFARRLEKSMTVLQIIGQRSFVSMIRTNRAEAEMSVSIFRGRLM